MYFFNVFWKIVFSFYTAEKNISLMYRTQNWPWKFCFPLPILLCIYLEQRQGKRACCDQGKLFFSSTEFRIIYLADIVYERSISQLSGLLNFPESFVDPWYLTTGNTFYRTLTPAKSTINHISFHNILLINFFKSWTQIIRKSDSYRPLWLDLKGCLILISALDRPWLFTLVKRRHWQMRNNMYVANKNHIGTFPD